MDYVTVMKVDLSIVQFSLLSKAALQKHPVSQWAPQIFFTDAATAIAYIDFTFRIFDNVDEVGRSHDEYSFIKNLFFKIRQKLPFAVNRRSEVVGMGQLAEKGALRYQLPASDDKKEEEEEQQQETEPDMIYVDFLDGPTSFKLRDGADSWKNHNAASCADYMNAQLESFKEIKLDDVAPIAIENTKKITVHHTIIYGPGLADKNAELMEKLKSDGLPPDELINYNVNLLDLWTGHALNMSTHTDLAKLLLKQIITEAQDENISDEAYKDFRVVMDEAYGG